MRFPLLGLAIPAVLASLLASREAAALNFIPISDPDFQRVLSSLVTKDIKADRDLVEVFLRSTANTKAVLTMPSASCPIPVSVYNGARVPLFNVKVITDERRGSEKAAPLTTIVHIPYIPARTYARGSIACQTKNDSLAWDPDGRKVYLDLEPFGDATAPDADGIRAMLAADEDAVTDGPTFTKGTPESLPHPRSIARAALEMAEDEAGFKKLASALMQVPEGATLLGTFIAERPLLTRVNAMATAIAGATPASANTVLARVLGSKASGLPAEITAAFTARLCDGAPEDVRGAAWRTALVADGNEDATRAAVLKKCEGRKDQTKARLLAASAAELGGALRALQGDAFETALQVVLQKRGFGAAAIFLRDTKDAAKLERVKSAVFALSPSPEERGDVIFVLSGAQASALDATRAAMVKEGLAAIGGHARITELDLLKQVVAGKVPSPEIRKIILAERARADAAGQELLAAEVAKRLPAIKDEWVRARVLEGDLDVEHFLVAVPTPPRASVANLDEVTRALAPLENLDVPKEAFEPTFFRSATDVVIAAMPQPEAIAAAKRLDTARVVKEVCTRASAMSEITDEKRSYYYDDYGSVGGPDARATAASLGAALKGLEGGAACMTEIDAKASAKAFARIRNVGLCFVAALVPFGFAGFAARRKYRPVREKLKQQAKELEKAAGIGTVAARFDRGLWTRSVRAGIDASLTWLAADVSPEVQRASELLRSGLAPAADGTNALEQALLARARKQATLALETGEVRSSLFETGELSVHLVCFPGRDDQPQTVRRHAAFAQGFAAYAKKLRKACLADGKSGRLLSLLFFVRADARVATMLAAYEGETVRLVPETLAAGEPDDVRPHGQRAEIMLDTPRDDPTHPAKDEA